MTLYKICHQSGRVLFTTHNEVTARNREQIGWKVIKVDKSREQFEQKIQHSYGEDYLVVNDDGDYVNWITADLWEFWQASRAAIEVELPDSTEFDGPDMSGDQSDSRKVN